MVATVELCESCFGITPKRLNAIDMGFFLVQIRFRNETHDNGHNRSKSIRHKPSSRPYWVKKNLTRSIDQKRYAIEPIHPHLSCVRQCHLLDLPRSTYDYVPIPASRAELDLMARIDRFHFESPMFGSRRLAHQFNISRDKAQRLMHDLHLALLPFQAYKTPCSTLPDAVLFPRPSEIFLADTIGKCISHP
jgi:hypothetical protein